MTNALRALLNGIIDYAGIFPPANLPIPEAVAKYSTYKNDSAGWLLSRFVCPASRLAELPAGTAMPITAIARGGDSLAAVVQSLKQDLADIASNKVDVTVLEMRFPPALFGSAHERDAAGLFAAVEKSLAESRTQALQVFLELPAANATPQAIASFTRTLAMANQIGAMRKVDSVPDAGVKLRCAGKEYPSSEVVARVMAACRNNNLRMKFTGGLHHPLRHAEGHGFLNVFVAGVLAHALDFDEAQLAQVLESRDAKGFVFSDNEAKWQGNVVTAQQIEAARREFVTSFGSCSFDEPRDGLRSLKLL